MSKKTVPFIWTNDDLMHGKTPELRQMCEFLEPFGIKGDFFTVPHRRGTGDVDDDPEFMKATEVARSAGHCFHQHGYLHTAFESGVPLLWMLDFSDAAKFQYDHHRFSLDQSHTVEALATMLEKGRKVWRRAFGEEPRGYRPGWGSFCQNLIRAMDLLGFDWISFTMPTRVSWIYNQGLWDTPWSIDEGQTGALCRVGQMLEFPIIGDYAFRVPNQPERIETMLELAKKEFLYFHEQGWPVTVVSHPQGLAFEGGSGYEVHRRILTWVLESGLFEPMTLQEAYDQRIASPDPLPDCHLAVDPAPMG